MELQLQPATRPKKSRKYLIPALIILLAMAAVAVWLYMGRIVSPDAVVGGQVAVLAAPFDGRIIDVPVADGQLVAPDTLLIQLDDSYLQSAVQEARTRLQALDSGAMGAPLSPEAIRVAEQTIMATIQKARRDEDRARRDLEHMTTLHVQAQLVLRRLESQVSRPASGAQRNAAQLAVIEAQGNMEQARADSEAASRLRAAAGDSLRQFRLEVTRQQQQQNMTSEQRLQQRQVQAMWLAQAEEAFEAASIDAPFAGLVGNLQATPGMAVVKGQPLGTVTPVAPANFWVDAVISDNDAPKIKEGMHARVDFPEASPPLTLDGTVEQLMNTKVPGDDQQNGSPLRALGKVFTVRIVFPPETEIPAGALRIGMRGRAVLFTY